MEKPDRCFECPFLSESVNMFVPDSPKGKKYFEAMWKCKLAPNDVEYPWRSYDQVSKTVEKWCPIEDVKENDNGRE
jgi:hypothetical protein